MAGPEKSAKRRLTDRQAAVLAAVERLGRPAMGDLWNEFPDLQPSAIKKVLDSLSRKGLVDSAGDPGQVYLGGVHWWSTAISPTRRDQALERIVEALADAELGLDVSVDDQEHAVTLFLPLSEVERLLQGAGSQVIARIGKCVHRLDTDGLAVRAVISTEVAIGPEPRLAAKLVPLAL
jgi:hypothetical protein